MLQNIIFPSLWRERKEGIHYNITRGRIARVVLLQLQLQLQLGKRRLPVRETML